MEIVTPSVELEQFTIDAEKFIERIGRKCYQSSHRITPDSAKPFIEMILNRGHESVIEHAVATVTFVMDRGCCYDGMTEVLTRGGWRPFREVTKADELACLSDAGSLEWHRPMEVQRYQFDGDLLAFESSSLDLLVTPNHNMWVFDHEKRSDNARVWKFLRADELINGRYKMTKTARWAGRAATVKVPPHPTKRLQFPAMAFSERQTGDLFELLGLWVTDGSYRNGKNGGSSVQISCSKETVASRIDELCHVLGLRVSWYKNEARIDNLRLLRFMEGLFGRGAKTFSVQVPGLIKEASPQQIRRFLAGVVAGDGNVHRENGHVVIYTASPVFAGDLQELWMKVGLSANVRTVAPRERGEIAGVQVRMASVGYVVSVHGKKRSIPLVNRRSARKFAEPVPYSGMVYCATVPYHRLYVRRNGKAVWCGNSHELVRHRLAAYSQESTRYCRYREGIRVIEPPGLGPRQRMLWLRAVRITERVYLDLLEDGVKPEIARAVLPTCLKTEITMTCNLREWRHVLKLRLSKRAHPQMREVAAMVFDLFVEKSMTLFDEFAELRKAA